MTEHKRGDDAYFRDLETQRYRSHRHLPPWIEAMMPGKSVLEIGCGVGLDTYALARHSMEVTAVDLTHVGVSTASGRFRRLGLAGEFLVVDACCRLSPMRPSISFILSVYCTTWQIRGRASAKSIACLNREERPA